MKIPYITRWNLLHPFPIVDFAESQDDYPELKCYAAYLEEDNGTYVFNNHEGPTRKLWGGLLTHWRCLDCGMSITVQSWRSKRPAGQLYDVINTSIPSKSNSEENSEKE